MTVLLRVVLAAAVLAASAAPAFAAGECLVDDPTGTPLNVRAEPNGAILTTLENGVQVTVLEEARLGNKRWFLVARQGARLGWIFGAYVVCPKSGDAREAAPAQPADRR